MRPSRPLPLSVSSLTEQDIEYFTGRERDLRYVTNQLNLLNNGTIGITGPRGIGKSSFVTKLLVDWGAKERGYFTMKMDVPTSYDIMDCLQSLLRSACERALETEEIRRIQRKARLHKSIPLLISFYVTLMLAFFMTVIYGSLGLFISTDILTLGGGLLLLIVVFYAVHSLCFAVFRKLLTRGRRRIYGEIMRILERLDYSQRLKTGRTIESPLLSILTLKYSKEVELERRSYTLPLLVEEFRNFMLMVTDGVQGIKKGAVVAIDELDKFDDVTKVNDFLQQIKGIFSIPNTFFMIVGTSEIFDMFEGRRDDPSRSGELDSTLDFIIELGEVSVRDTQRIISRRVKDPPFTESAIAAIHSAARGRPREVIRITREVLAFQVGTGRTTPVDDAFIHKFIGA